MSGKSMRGRVRLRALLVMLVLAGALIYGWHDYSRFSNAPLNVTAQGETIDVSRGSSFRTIIGELRQRHFTGANSVYWRLLAEQLRVAGKLHAGEYALNPGITPRQLLANMAGGRVLQRLFTIVDGWTFDELRQALGRTQKLNHDSAGLDNAAIMQKLGAPGEAPEGRFLPETYAYVKGDSDLGILKRARAAMDRTLATLWPARAAGLPLATPYEALILASIVEKETGRPEERARIAGVFVRRLQNHMLLQTDPSVIYGMGASYAGNIRKGDLSADTPYNTYTRPGLPPTPIALPGKPAIEAALHPAAGNALYFVARGDGGHVFAGTLADHNRNVDCYQRKHCQ
jgi:peptidoglycan lytic transglycosylase G